MANDATDTTSAQDGADGGVHRLRDILVEEVSLVDRAANKRRFLIVKRSDMAKSAAPDKGEKKPPGAKKPKAKAPAKAAANRSKAKARGRSPGSYGAGTRKAAKAADDEYDDDDETEKAAGGEDQSEDEDNEDEAEKADEYDDEDEAEKADDEDGDDETEAEKADGEEEDGDDEDENSAKADDEDDDEAEKAAKAGDEEYDDQPSGKRPAPKKKTTAKADGDDDSDDGDGDDDSDDGDSVVLPADLKTTLLRALTQGIERLVAVANRIKDADSSDDNAAAYVPEDLAEEIDDIGELLEGIGERLPTTKAIAKGGARMAKDRLNRFQKALELLSQVLKELTEAKQPAVPSGGAGKRTTKRDATPGVAELVTHVADLLAVVQQQQGQIDRIRKAHGTSNALVVEGSSRDRRAPAEVSWPFDMNRPISRDSVAKATSFYDDAD